MYSPTQYRISTITAIGSLFCAGRSDTDNYIDLDLLYNNLNVVLSTHNAESMKDAQDNIKNGILYVEYGVKKSDTIYKGFSKKFLINRRKETSSKRFDNQLTVIYKFNEECIMNIKIFKNGNVQITGVKKIDQGKEMIDILIETITSITKNEPNVVKDVSKLQNTGYKVALINSDFKIGFEVKRDRLHSVLITSYENKCSFEPCIYPGVKIQYFWNNSNHTKDGICRCKESCFAGKGNGCGDGDCKKITIAVFQSGCIIITGAQNTQQIDDAYAFITGLLYKHVDHIKKVSIAKAVKEEAVQQKPKIIIKKSSIIYPSGLHV
jgi:TATA-box binding protein (TBP) (component of TFIID and TFIIIB)